MLVLLLAFSCANEWNALDADGDGWTVAAGDCWDETAPHGGLEASEIHPEAPDLPYDGVDADCAGDDDFDHDGDGYVTSIWADPVTEGIPSSLPGGDCWDDRDEIEQEFGALPGFPQLAAADVHPGADDTWYDGIDANCDGGDDFDQDADGHPSAFHRDGASTLGDDCYDAEGDPFENPKSLPPADVHPDATDVCYDATDADCDGKSDWDCDHDGFLVDADCDDENAEKHPGAVEKWYDGIDQDCDGNDADQDHDGYLKLDYAGDVRAPGIAEGDCQDDDPDLVLDAKNGLPALHPQDVHPFAIETWYDGIDQDCDDPQDFDQDLDGYDAAGMDGSVGSPDCVDIDAKINPGEDESCTTLYDDNCNGDDNDAPPPYCIDHFYDGDRDGYGDVGTPAKCVCGFSPWDVLDDNTDCDDAHDTINPGETETVDDATDENCDGYEACYIDDDGDSWRTDSTTKPSADLDCTDPTEGGAGTREGDCNDDDPVTNPDADDSLYCNDGIDQNCDGSSAGCSLVGPTSIADVAVGSVVGDTDEGLGYAIAAGDLDGDGTPDVVITANGASTGTVYGFLAPISALEVATSARDFQIDSSDSFGESLAASADLDGDGVNDVAVGNPFADTTSTDAGGVFLFFDSLSGAYTEADADLVLEGEGGDDQLGVSLAAGDWNDDGNADLAIGANSQDTGATRAGALWVLFGPLATSDVLGDDADAIRYGVSTDDHATRSLASGDVDGDGVDDIVVGVPFSNAGGASDAGGIYVVLGPLTGESSFSTADCALYGENAMDAAGSAVAVGDFEGSGYADVLVGAPHASSSMGGLDAGVAYLVMGDGIESGDIPDLARASVAGATGGLAGSAIGSAGDFDNDGRLDLFVGAPGNSHLAIFYEPPTGNVDLTTGPDLVLAGTGVDDSFGYSACSVGDQDGDAIDDLIVGAPDTTSGGAGTAWIILGAGM